MVSLRVEAGSRFSSSLSQPVPNTWFRGAENSSIPPCCSEVIEGLHSGSAVNDLAYGTFPLYS